MTPTGVYDTKVIVSATLKPESIPASLVALAMEGSVRLILSPEILEEYREVLKRPKFAFDPSSVDAFLHDIEKAAVMLYPTKRVRLPRRTTWSPATRNTFPFLNLKEQK
jgi:uncharacterized protein